MELLYGTPIVLASYLFILFLAGLAVLVFGKRRQNYATWIIGILLVGLLAMVALGWSSLVEEGLHEKRWLTGWILPRDEPGAITVGVLQDPLGLTMVALATILSGIVLLNRGLLAKEPSPERYKAAFAISTVGVSISWIAMTPWLSFVGIGLAILGGFVSLGSRWDTDGEANVAMRFGWEKSWGLFLAVLGACILAGSRPPLDWANAESWAALPGSSDEIGAGLLAAGLFIQLQSFPLTGWIITSSGSPPVLRVVLNQVFPALAVFGVLIRLEPQLRSVGILPVFGWVALGSALFTIGSGFLQTQGRQGLSLWISAGFSVVFSTLAFSGQWVATAVLIGLVLGAAAFSIAVSAFDVKGPKGASNGTKSDWIKVACFAAVAAATGVLGFVSAGGILRWLAVWDSSALEFAAGFVFFLFVLHGWKLAWNAFRVKSISDASWFTISAPFVLIVLALGLVWTGTASGEAVFEAPDRLFASLFDILFGSSSARDRAGDGEALSSALWLLLGIQAVAFATAYWTSGRKLDLFQQAARTFPRFSAFLTSGYGVDRFGLWVLGIMRATGSFIDWAVGEQFAGRLGGTLAVRLIRNTAAAFTAADDKFSERLNATVLRVVQVPGKVFQLIQNGDVQWYLLFGIGSGMAMLLHFMRG
ncbi:MAG: hypothetical protein A2428_04660 [Bdellovibrionales bacterium RIFOXYC1_FULL_54_43]|nr:MAG: hypothetical protein A2428_04660 [Bdellovibrionales bacterium RIFOXYC1_FULL_54_43]OFZ78855.1 MAG: hypothetical protein A2603_08530 [Bdellovibrionales bacterium RIFOXYD1_FULL_55_31]